MRTLLFFLFLVPILLIAQKQTVLKGNILVGSSKCEEKFNLNYKIIKVESEQLQVADSMFLDSCRFLLPIQMEPGNYQLVLHVKGYYSETLPFSVSLNDSLNEIQFPNSTLVREREVTNLNDVTVTGIKRSLIRLEANKVFIQVKDNDLLTISSVYDALRKLPGTFITPGGEINYKGKGVTIYLDGLPSNLAGTNLINFLKGFPASSVERFEIIPNPGASYDADLQGAIIDVVTRGVAVKWVSGSLNLNYGKNQNDKLSPSLVLNAKRKKSNWQLLVGTGSVGSTQTETMKLGFLSFAPIIHVNNTIEAQDQTMNTYVKPSVSIKVSKKSLLMLNYNLYSNATDLTLKSKRFSQSSSDFYTNDANNRSVNTSQEFIAKYRINLDTLNKTVELTGYTSIFNGTTTMKATQNDNSSVSFSKYNFTGNSMISYVKFDVKLPLPWANFTLGSKFNREINSNLGKYAPFRKENTVFETNSYDSALDFNYEEKNVAGYVEIQKKINKFDLGVGLRAENYNLDRTSSLFTSSIVSNYFNLFPNASLTYFISPVMNLSAAYSKKINVPAASLFDPNNSNYYDKYITSKGNIQLKPTIYDNFNVSFTAFDYFSLSADYTLSNNPSITTLSAEKGEKSFTNSPQNYSEQSYLNLNMGLPVPLGIFTQGLNFFNQQLNPDELNYFYFNIGYNRIFLKNYTYPTTYEPFWSYSLLSHFVLPYKFSLNINYSYVALGYYQIFRLTAPIHGAEIVLSKDFFNKQLTASLSVSDPINTNQTSIQLISSNLDFSQVSKNDTRVVWLNLSYNFGKHQHMMNEKTIIETDKKQKKSGGLF